MRFTTMRPTCSLAGRAARLLILAAGLSAGAQPALAGCMNGINLAGAEFGTVPGTYGKEYIYPSPETIDYFADKGFNTVRLPFRWERIQRRLNGALDRKELARLKESVAAMRARNQTVILDLHNYARYNEKIVGTPAVPTAALADVWSRLAKIFANQEGVVFGLMNEPFDMNPTDWLPSANASIAAIRKTGARNLVLVPGVSWTGAHSWKADINGSSNASTMIKIEDPAGNFAFEVHQYLDEDFSGTHDTCPRGEDAANALRSMTDWFRETKTRGFLGEFGGSATSDCLIGLSRMVDVMAEAPDVWLGWTYWAAGDWWSPDEPLNIQPVKGADRLQLKALTTRKLATDKDACAALDARKTP
jgi:endoglucanase